ncbi:MAG: hypothetical protein GX587_12825 [Bacteroidales bacterium]|nr:hypothetical protein [Bacteroidales bacterium]
MAPEVRTVHIANAKLNEGSEYEFLVLKRTGISESEQYFILQDPFGYKILLPELPYREYGFSQGSHINCRVDKISCSGRIYLEPNHPVYKEGLDYDFIVTGKKEEWINGIEKQCYLELLDALNKPCRVLVSVSDLDKYLTQGFASCKLDRIKKGVLFLRLTDELHLSEYLIEGNAYPFFIEKKDKSSFILIDNQGHRHLLNAMWYSEYTNLRIGSTINCKVIKRTSEGCMVLEPEHPYYNEGQEYYFNILRIEKNEFADGAQDVLAVCSDGQSGTLAHVNLQTGWESRLSGKEQVRGRITRIRKGRVYAEALFDDEFPD